MTITPEQRERLLARLEQLLEELYSFDYQYKQKHGSTPYHLVIKANSKFVLEYGLIYEGSFPVSKHPDTMTIGADFEPDNDLPIGWVSIVSKEIEGTQIQEKELKREYILSELDN